MNGAQLDQVRKWFEAFAERFRDAAGALPAPIALKLDHTRRVAENARDVARDLGWSPADVDLAEALGWLHDVGRFVQYAEFGHFHDATSCDHGQRGADVVRDSGLLADLDEEARAGLLDGIRHHSAKTIPADLPADRRRLLELIRDADKLDIFRVVIEGLEHNGFRELADMWPQIDLDGPVDAQLLDEISTRRRGDLARVHSRADFLLLLVSWAYDLSFAPARARARRAGVPDALASHLPDAPGISGILDAARRFLDAAAAAGPFEADVARYEAWFERHPAAYASELAAVRELWPAGADALEIGVGAGHFAAPLDIRTGVEPAAAMRQRAGERGLDLVAGVAERLPFPDGRFDAALMVTTICFVADPAQSLRETFRVLRPGGGLVVGFVDRASPLGLEYERNKENSVFYKTARFFDAAEVAKLLAAAGFVDLEYRQTLFAHPDQMQEPDPVRTGFGAGAFVAIRGRKPEPVPC
ncbi:MAG: methyltransferase domain-containing protein [Kiritimatiellia bacterium]